MFVSNRRQNVSYRRNYGDTASPDDGIYWGFRELDGDEHLECRNGQGDIGIRTRSKWSCRTSAL